MIIINEFKKLDFDEQGVILEFKSGNQMKIKYMQLDDIFIKKYKIVQIRAIMFSSIVVLIYCSIIINIKINLYIFFILFILVSAFIKWINNVYYDLFVILDDGKVYIKRISKNDRFDMFNSINKIRMIKYNHLKNI